ncbi:MAG: nuclear transport factor 2 family protein [Proteobacteria bacterium]|nr:nuclear transport factor 2 family protein [Pseudomonadota bacterium]
MDEPGKDFAALLGRMTQAICRGDAQGATACFTPQGAYHDGFYGEFTGREEIERMLREFFYRDAERFEWTLHDAVSDGSTGYAQYDFSYVSRLEGSAGKRVGFSGVSICALEGGLIAHYGECFERAPVLAKLGFAQARILKSVQRWAKEAK